MAMRVGLFLFEERPWLRLLSCHICVKSHISPVLKLVGLKSNAALFFSTRRVRKMTTLEGALPVGEAKKQEFV